jgi:hypothetical protein
MKGYWFTSSLFKIEAGEDTEINPGRYGRQLAVWLKMQLEARGYWVEGIINEDWGRCLVCSRDPFMLCVGCGNVDFALAQMPIDGAMVWHCFAVAEIPFWTWLFWMQLLRRSDTASAALEKLDKDLGAILSASSDIQLIAEP